MPEKLREIVSRYDEITRQMELPENYTDAAAYSRLAREQKELAPVAECAREYFAAQEAMTEAEGFFADPELGEMAREEYEEARARLGELSERLRELLIPKDPDDDRNVIIEIRAGVGGEESALFAHSLYRMYSMYAESRRWKVSVANVNDTELGGIKEISFMVEGTGAYARFKYESGVHRVQRVPETEAGGRIHTSTVTVAVLPEVSDVEINIDPGDLQIDTFRSSGAGGQHVNKTESAIRITHLPTGTVVECQDERSQYKNKDRAMKILASRLYEAERARQMSERAAERKSQVGTGMRNERIRTYNFPQGRVTDHRIGLTLYKIDRIMDGELDELIDALAAAARAGELGASEANDADCGADGGEHRPSRGDNKTGRPGGRAHGDGVRPGRQRPGRGRRGAHLRRQGPAGGQAPEPDGARSGGHGPLLELRPRAGAVAGGGVLARPADHHRPGCAGDPGDSPRRRQHGGAALPRP